MNRFLVLLCLGACGAETSQPTVCRLLPGDVVISEIYANPPGDDAGGEWFEVHNAASTIVDLAGMTVVAAKGDGSGARQLVLETLAIGPGSDIVLGGVAPDLAPEYVTYAYGSGLGALRQTDGLLALRCGTTIVDQASYAEAPEAASLELSGAQPPDALANDDPARWCAASAEFAPGQRGTPGQPNRTCPGSDPRARCLDQGVERDVRAPGPGDLTVSEIMADPNGTDADREWFEVHALHDADLVGLEIGTAPGMAKDTLDGLDCRAVAEGSYLVFARQSDVAKNGGLTRVYAAESIGLANGGGQVVLSYAGQVIDSVIYPKALAGSSFSVDPDDPSRSCAGIGSYGDGGKGTPGAANPPCP